MKFTGAYETATNAPIKKLWPSGRTNTCLLIAFTFYGNRALMRNRQPESLMSFFGGVFSPTVALQDEIGLYAVVVLTLLPFGPATPGPPVCP